MKKSINGEFGIGLKIQQEKDSVVDMVTGRMEGETLAPVMIVGQLAAMSINLLRK